MPKQVSTLSPRGAAVVSGIGYAVLFVLAIFANFFVRTGLVDPDSPARTFTNIAGSEMLFRTGLVAFLLIFLIDVVVAWGLYVLFKAVNREVSLLAAWMRLVYTVFLGVGVVFLLVVVQLVSGAGYLAAFEQGQLDAHVALSLEAFNYAWLIGLAAFGLHLMLLAYLMLASGTGPRALGVVLAVAGTAYVFDTLANALVVSYADHADVFLMIVAVPAVVAELWFTLWLLLRAGKRPVVHEPAPRVLQDA